MRSTRHREWMLHALVVLATCAVFHNVILHPGNVVYSNHSDVLAQHYPFRFLLADSIRTCNQLPLWNRYSFCGMPLLGDPQSGLFYPPNWLHCLVPLRWTAAIFGWLILLHVITAGSGMLIWLRGHNLAGGARLVGALSFMFAGKWITHILVPGHVVFLPIAWIPWQLALIDRLCARPNLRSAALLALVSAIAFLGFHPQLFLFSELFVGAYALFQSTQHTTKRTSLLAASAIISVALSAGLVMIQFLPSIELITACQRASGLDYEKAARRSLALNKLHWFLLPHEAGPKDWEIQPYLGVLPLVFSLFGVVQRQRRTFHAFFFLGLLFCVTYSLGPAGGIHKILFDWTPGFRLFRLPMRILLIAGLPVGYLAAVGATQLVTNGNTTPRWVAASVLLAGGVTLAIVKWNVDGVIACIGLTIPILVITVTTLKWCRFLWPCLCLITFLEFAYFAIPMVQTRRIDDALGENPIVPLLTGYSGQSRVYSVGDRFPTDDPLPPAYAVPGRIELLRGFNPLIPSRTHRFLRQGVGGESPSTSAREIIRNFEIKNRRLFDLLGVRFVASPRTLDLPDLRQIQTFDGLKIYHYSQRGGGRTLMPRVFLYENLNALPRAMVVSAAVAAENEDEAFKLFTATDFRKKLPLESIELPQKFQEEPPAVSISTDRELIKVELDTSVRNGGYLLLTEMWYPGWRAYKGDRTVKVLRAGGTFCAVKLSPQDRTVVFEYKPRTYLVGQIISLASLILTILLIFFSDRLFSSKSEHLQSNDPTSVVRNSNNTVVADSRSPPLGSS